MRRPRQRYILFENYLADGVHTGMAPTEALVMAVSRAFKGYVTREALLAKGRALLQRRGVVRALHALGVRSDVIGKM